MVDQEVSFGSGALQLAGTLARPEGEGPFAGVVLIPGSGQIDRDESHKSLRLNVFPQLAAHLAEHGFATVRYDKRGVGASEGDFWETGLFDNGSDASSALDFLRTQERISPGRLFLVGHSEGALIATRLAAQGADVAGVVLLSGSARSGEEVLKWQAPRVAKGLRGPVKWLIKLLRIDVVKSQQKQIDKIKRSSGDWYRTQLIAKVNAKWMREFMSYDPSGDLPGIRVPVLAITGSKDIQVDPQDLRRMAEIVQADFEYHEVPDVSHILRAEPGEPSVSSYKKQAQQPVDPRVLQALSDWLTRQVESSARRERSA